jgi:hypothetical protein
VLADRRAEHGVVEVDGADFLAGQIQNVMLSHGSLL